MAITTVYGNALTYWKTYMKYEVIENEDSVTINAEIGVYYVRSHSFNYSSTRPCYLSCDGAQTDFTPTGTVQKSSGETYKIGTHTYTIMKGRRQRNVDLTAYINRTSGDAGTSTVTVPIIIPALYMYNIKVKVDGVWKDGIPKVKVNGQWKEADAIYIKVDGEWLQ